MNATAWLLVLQMVGGSELSTGLLASEAECKRLAVAISAEFAVKKSHCFEYRKATEPARPPLKITT